MKEIDITHADIANGRRFSLSLCPVGLAAQRVFPGREITVGYGMIGVDEELWRLSKEDEQYLHDYESSKPVEPRTMTLSLIEKRK